MINKEPTFVSFNKTDGRYEAYISIKEFLGGDRDIEYISKRAGVIYTESINKMKSTLNVIKLHRESRTVVPARTIWMLGDQIFEMVNKLKELSIEIDDIYEHLERDLQVKRKWLEKVIIFRRYLSEINKIPESLPWGRCEKGTRRAAENLLKFSEIRPELHGR